MDKNKLLKLRFSLKQRITIYEKLAAFLDAGIPILNSVEAIRDRCVKNKDFKAGILNSWIADLSQGKQFSSAIKEWIPSSEYMLISAGERGQGLTSGLREAAVLSMAAKRSKSTIIKSSIQPLLLLLAVAGMLSGFQIQMVPIFSNLMPVVRWPSSAQFLESVSGFIYHNVIFIIIGLIILGFIMAWSMGRWTNSVRYKIFDKIPPWSIYRNYQASSFLIGLSSLMKAGISLNDALSMIHKNSSEWAKRHFEQMMSSLKRASDNHGEALDTGMLDDETAGDVQDYARLGTFQDAIYIMGKKSIESGVQRIEVSMGVLKNMMLCVVGLSLMWIYFVTYNLQTTIASSVG